jgi:hyaluronan synthase
MALRQLRHLHERPGDLLRMPLFIMFSTVVLMPIRIYGFFRLGHVGGWGTRANAHTARSDSEVRSDGAVLGSAAPGIVAADGSRPPSGRPPEEPVDGDPRGLLPYLFAIALLAVGVVYDAHV